MGLFDKIRGELVDIIEWLDPTNDVMSYRFERHNNEIKNGAKLIVRPGQAAVFVNEGEVADEFPPGTYTLETQNLPILSTLQGWKYGFNSPFKAEVYFFNTKVFTNMKWGTSNPITLRDKELGPVRLRAFGTFSMRIAHPATMLRQLISTDGMYRTDEITEQLRKWIVNQFAVWTGRANISIFDLAAKYNEMGSAMLKEMEADFYQLGLEVTQVLIENISLPSEVEAAIDKRTQMSVLGDMRQYTQFQAANALEASAENPSGGNPAMEMGLGLAMGQQMAQALSGSNAPGAVPPPVPQTTVWYVAEAGQQKGPFDAQTLQSQIASGTVKRETLVWKQGMANWSPAGDIPELAKLFGSTPPPAPPPAP